MEEKIPLLCVVGPTASGKTKLAVSLAERFGGEVVSADSMQIYRGMKIATAKPTPEEMGNIPHHLIDFLEPEIPFSVAQYAERAKRIIREIYGRNRLPLLAGGTGLYVQAVTENIAFSEGGSDPAYREELKRLAEEKGNEAVLELLRREDPELAPGLHPNNLNRIIRALEVKKITGIPLSEHNRRSRSEPLPYRLCMLGLSFHDRERLYRRIDSRVDRMLEMGLLEEAKLVLEREKHAATAMQAIGYKELRGYFEGKIPLELAVENLKRETRRYAKRQLTWFKRDSRIRWLMIDEFENETELLEAACETVGNSGILPEAGRKEAL